jgi:hypothetical protein
MKRIVGLFLLLLTLSSAVFLNAQEKNNPAEMTGWICNSRCLKPVNGRATCDPSCHPRMYLDRRVMVFVDDQGKVTRIANPKMVKPFMGKKVKVKCEFVKDKMRIYDVQLANPE